MHLFYHSPIEGETHELDELESKHAIRVLRLIKGDRVVLVDGQGGWFDAEIQEANPRKCLLKIISVTTEYNPLPYRLHLAISPTKNMERFEWFLEKATEIGVSEVTPLICHRTERKQLKLDRLDRILVSAMKQSLRAYKPEIHEPAKLSEFVLRKCPGTRGIAHCLPSQRLALHDLDRKGRYTLLVGPEGDFTEKEVSDALDAGFSPFHLGDSRMRTETAGVHLCSAIQILESLGHPF
jgi:16S rRNA (uracil1498-N3)-methyltransferase